jgi:hypothetical protein
MAAGCTHCSSRAVSVPILGGRSVRRHGTAIMYRIEIAVTCLASPPHPQLSKLAAAQAHISCLAVSPSAGAPCDQAARIDLRAALHPAPVKNRDKAPYRCRAAPGWSAVARSSAASTGAPMSTRWCRLHSCRDGGSNTFSHHCSKREFTSATHRSADGRARARCTRPPGVHCPGCAMSWHLADDTRATLSSTTSRADNPAAKILPAACRAIVR